MPPQRRIEPRFAALTAALIAFVIYGSLYPFHFYSNPNPAGPLRALLATYRDRPPRSDLVANIVLYMPLGFLAIQCLRRRPRWPQILLVILAGVTLSAAMELTQFYDRGRSSGMSDVYANAGGTVLGAIAGLVLHRQVHLPSTARIRQRPFVAWMIASWLAYRLFPYAPLIDIHAYWGALKPLVLTPKLPLHDLYRHIVVWLALAMLFEALIGSARAGAALFVLFPAILCARILMGTALSAAEVTGGLVGVLTWILWLSRMPARVTWIAALFVGVVVMQGLEPFRFTAPARAFGWIPFRSFLEGSIGVNVLALFEKTFTYGTMTWLWVRAGYPLRTSAWCAGLLVLCLRFAQVYIPGRSAEITDFLMVMILAGMMKVLAEDRALTAP